MIHGFYFKVLNIIRRCIIATDLVQFFKNKDEFKTMVDNKMQPFSWEEEKCRNVTMALAMTSCDLTSGIIRMRKRDRGRKRESER